MEYILFQIFFELLNDLCGFGISIDFDIASIFPINEIPHIAAISSRNKK